MPMSAEDLRKLVQGREPRRYCFVCDRQIRFGATRCARCAASFIKRFSLAGAKGLAQLIETKSREPALHRSEAFYQTAAEHLNEGRPTPENYRPPRELPPEPIPQKQLTFADLPCGARFEFSKASCGLCVKVTNVFYEDEGRNLKRIYKTARLVVPFE